MSIANSNNTIVESTTDDDAQIALINLSNFLKMNCEPTIIVLGILGNLLNLVTLSHVAPGSVICCAKSIARNGNHHRTKKANNHSHQNHQSAAMSVLICMSAADLFYLVAQVPGFVHPPTYAHRFYECFLRSWMSNISLTAVALFGACVAVERYAAVRNKEKLTRFFASHVVLLLTGVTFFSATIHLPRFFERTPDLDYSRVYPECNKTTYHGTSTYQVLWYVTVMVNTVIPLLVMTTFGSAVARSLVRIEQQHKSMGLTSTGRAEERIALATRMMAVSIAVFAFASIGGIITVLIISFGGSQILTMPAFRLFATINNILTSLKSSINFALYCTTSALYRHALRNIVLCRKPSFDGQCPRVANNSCAFAKAKPFSDDASASKTLPTSANVPVPCDVTLLNNDAVADHQNNLRLVSDKA